MPLYEYECESCGVRFERIQKFSDPLEDTCPTCGGKVHKLLSSPAIQFKGSGFYITDYAKKSDSRDEKAASKSGGDKDKSDKGDKAEKSEAAPSASSSESSSTSTPATPASTTTKTETSTDKSAKKDSGAKND